MTPTRDRSATTPALARACLPSATRWRSRTGTSSRPRDPATSSVSARLSFGQAAVVALSGLAALQGLRAGRIAAGQKVLIIGTSGGIGTYAVQLAKGLRRQGHR